MGAVQNTPVAEMFRFWTTPGSDGTHPTLDEAVKATKWVFKRQPRIVGDAGLRYSDVKAGPQPRGVQAKLNCFREQETNHSKDKVTHWTWKTRIAESQGVGVTLTQVHVYGWRGEERQELPNARTPLGIRIEPLGQAMLDSHIRYTRYQNPAGDGRLLLIYYGIDDNGHYVSVKLQTVVVPGGPGGTSLEY